MSKLTPAQKSMARALQIQADLDCAQLQSVDSIELCTDGGGSIDLITDDGGETDRAFRCSQMARALALQIQAD